MNSNKTPSPRHSMPNAYSLQGIMNQYQQRGGSTASEYPLFQEGPVPSIEAKCLQIIEEALDLVDEDLFGPGGLLDDGFVMRRARE
jgi:hypothetical protein